MRRMATKRSMRMRVATTKRRIAVQRVKKATNGKNMVRTGSATSLYHY